MAQFRAFERWFILMLIVAVLLTIAMLLIGFHGLSSRDPTPGESWIIHNRVSDETCTVILVDSGHVLYSYDRGHRVAAMSLENYHRSSGR